MNSDVMDDDAVSMIRMDIVNKMKHNSYRACSKLCVAQNLAEIRTGFELSQDAVEEWVLALAAIPSLTDAELRLMTNMIAELLERLIMRVIQLEEWLIAKTEYGYLTTSWETHNYISNIQMFVGRWVEYLVDIRKDIEDQNKVVVIAVPMQEVVQCQDRKIQEVDIDDETTVESAGEYTDTHSISEYEYGSDTITINSETDGEITEDEGQLENENEVVITKRKEHTVCLLRRKKNDVAVRKDLKINHKEFPETRRTHKENPKKIPLPHRDKKLGKARMDWTPLISIPEHSVLTVFYTCIPPVVLPAIIKAGSRSGSANRKRIPNVVDDIHVIFIEPVIYDVLDELRGHVTVVSFVMKCLLFLPYVRTTQDFAAHAG